MNIHKHPGKQQAGKEAAVLGAKLIRAGDQGKRFRQYHRRHWRIAVRDVVSPRAGAGHRLEQGDRLFTSTNM